MFECWFIREKSANAGRPLKRVNPVPNIHNEAFRILLETVPDGFFVHDTTGRFLDVNARSCADLGYSRDELLRMTINDISCGANPAENAERWRNAPAGMAMHFREEAKRKDGSTFPVEISLTCQMIDGAKLFFGLARDISESEAARESAEQAASELEQRVEARTAELAEAHDRMGMAVRVGGLGLWYYDFVGQTLECDAQWHRIMGRDPAQPVRTIAAFSEFIHPDDVERVTEVSRTAAELVEEGRDYGVVFRIFRPDGEIRWVRSAAQVVEGADGRPARAGGFVVDITESRLAEATLHRQASEDPLTGLANRRGLDEELLKACLHATRTGEPMTLAMIDVDHFKLFNDEQGHVRGDEALKAVADILQSAARRPYDLAARYGGDEFLLLLPGVEEPEALIDRILANIAALGIAHPGSPDASHLAVSCGCVIASELADISPQDLLAECDRALYQAKETGRNRAHISRL